MDPRQTFPLFRSGLRETLEDNRDRLLRGPTGTAQQTPLTTATAGSRPIVRIPPRIQTLPERPYPLLEPYSHPATLAGRDDDVAELRRLLRQQQPLLCIQAPSGAGKSSVLQAGLVPQLHDAGIPVGLDSHPDEPGLGARLIASIVAPPAPDVRTWDEFFKTVIGIRATGVVPVFILDQFETAFRQSRRQEVLAEIGLLLASTFQRVSGVDGVLCRWVLAYRQDFHGEVMAWLDDVLTSLRGQSGTPNLPHDSAVARSLRDLGAPCRRAASPWSRSARHRHPCLHRCHRETAVDRRRQWSPCLPVVHRFGRCTSARGSVCSAARGASRTAADAATAGRACPTARVRDADARRTPADRRARRAG
ncbi:MAG: hypothetical protein QM736_02690 [Vicinamibacterales bacterium]